MYTGPTASEMVKQYYAGREVPDLDLDKWSVFVLCKIEENMEIQADSKMLYQACLLIIFQCVLLCVMYYHYTNLRFVRLSVCDVT